ncbi:MAG: hypothetical protein R3F55_16380 [Alphaproteobacteria bacterium]
MDVDLAGIKRDHALDRARIDREKTLEAMEISRRQAFQEAEIGAEEEIERARLCTSLREARVLDATCARWRSSASRPTSWPSSTAPSRWPTSRRNAPPPPLRPRRRGAKAIAAEEQAFTAREREIAERRKAVD